MHGSVLVTRNNFLLKLSPNADFLAADSHKKKQAVKEYTAIGLRNGRTYIVETRIANIHAVQIKSLYARVEIVRFFRGQ